MQPQRRPSRCRCGRANGQWQLTFNRSGNRTHRFPLRPVSGRRGSGPSVIDPSRSRSGPLRSPRSGPRLRIVLVFERSNVPSLACRRGRSERPSLTVETYQDGWLMRASGGTVRRTNCISPTPFRSDDFTSVLAAGEALYHRLGRPTIVKILSIGDDVDEMLADRGYTIDAPSQVLWAPTSRVGPDPKQWQSRREPCLRIGSRLGWRSVAHPGWQLSECVLVSHNLACRLCIVSAEGRDRCLGVRHHPSRHSRYRRRRDKT